MSILMSFNRRHRLIGTRSFALATFILLLNVSGLLAGKESKPRGSRLTLWP